MTHVHDVLAVGAGPFNLSFAALADPVEDLDVLVLESRDEVAWHPGLMLPEATLQVPFMADLVTMADPTSPHSFLAWLRETDRLYPFYIRESFYPLRAEYDAYLRWAADRLGVRLGRHVESVEHDGETFVVEALTADGAETHRAHALVLGVGTRPSVPAPLRSLGGPVLHGADYLTHRDRLQAGGSVTVVGSGQSAAEIYRDLLPGTREHGYHLTWLTRSPRFFPMEYTKLTLELTSPEFVEYFRDLPADTRDELVPGQKALHKGISSDLVDELYDTLYRMSASGPVATTLRVSSTSSTTRCTG